MRITLGDIGIDILTGFRGRVTAICRYLTGCDQVCLTPSGTDNGKRLSGEWFDVERVKVHQPDTVTLLPGLEGDEGKPSGGPPTEGLPRAI